MCTLLPWRILSSCPNTSSVLSPRYENPDSKETARVWVKYENGHEAPLEPKLGAGYMSQLGCDIMFLPLLLCCCSTDLYLCSSQLLQRCAVHSYCAVLCGPVPSVMYPQSEPCQRPAAHMLACMHASAPGACFAVTVTAPTIDGTRRNTGTGDVMSQTTYGGT